MDTSTHYASVNHETGSLPYYDKDYGQTVNGKSYLNAPFCESVIEEEIAIVPQTNK